jgi:asparagine synthase (glutamine-hydrolysing)
VQYLESIAILQHQNILLSFNGEIYNFKALTKELDFDFKTQSDGEVIIESYLKRGVNFVQYVLSYWIKKNLL